MSVHAFADEAFCARFLVVLAHFAWQGALVGGVLALMLAVGRGWSARARYALSVGALLLMAVCPVGTVVWEAAATGDMAQAAPGRDQRDIKDQRDVRGLVAGLDETGVEGRSSGSSTLPGEGRLSGSSTLPWGEGRSSGSSTLPWGEGRSSGNSTLPLRRFAPVVLFLYLAGVSVMLLRLAAALGGGKRLQRYSEPVEDATVLQALARQARALGLRATPAVAWCGKVLTPTVVGVLRPMVLLPASAVTGLAPGQLELLILHELAHIRRYDPLVNVLQRLIEAALFFHPAVWYVSRRVRLEREHCCDDVVLAHGGEPRAYAESLLQAATLANLGRAGLAAAGGIGALGGGTDLRKRMRRVLGLEAQPVRLLRGGMLIGLLACGIAALAFAGTAGLGESGNRLQMAEAPAAQPTPETGPIPQPAGPQQPAGSAEQPEASKPTGLTASVDELVEQLKDEDWWLRKVAAQQLGTLDPKQDEFGSWGPELVAEALAGALKDENGHVRMAAAESLGQLGLSQAVKHLVAALKEEDEEVQNAAVEALKHFPEELVLPILTYAATDEDDYDVQLGAIRVLGNMKSTAALDVAILALRHVIRSDNMEALVKSLSGYPWEEVERRLRAITEARDEKAVHKLIWLLRYMEEPRLDDVLIRYAKEADTAADAVWSIAKQIEFRKGEDKSELVEVLRQSLRHQSADVRTAASNGLQSVAWEPPTAEDKAWYSAAQGNWASAVALGDVAIEPLLLTVKTTREGTDVTGKVVNIAGAIRALAEFKDARILPALEEVLFRQAEPEVGGAPESPGPQGGRIAAVDAIEKVGGDDAVRILILAVNHASSVEVQWAAAQALGRLRSEQAIPAIVDLMRRPSPPQPRRMNVLYPFDDAIVLVVERGGAEVRPVVADFLVAAGERGFSRLMGTEVNIIPMLVGMGTEQAAEILKLAYQKAGRDTVLRHQLMNSLRANSTLSPEMQRLWQELEQIELQETPAAK